MSKAARVRPAGPPGVALWSAHVTLARRGLPPQQIVARVAECHAQHRNYLLQWLASSLLPRETHSIAYGSVGGQGLAERERERGWARGCSSTIRNLSSAARSGLELGVALLGGAGATLCGFAVVRRAEFSACHSCIERGFFADFGWRRRKHEMDEASRASQLRRKVAAVGVQLLDASVFAGVLTPLGRFSRSRFTSRVVAVGETARNEWRSAGTQSGFPQLKLDGRRPASGETLGDNPRSSVLSWANIRPR